MRREEPFHQNGDHGKNNYLGVSRKKLDGLSYRLEKETHDRADDAVVLLISCRPFSTPLPSEFREVNCCYRPYKRQCQSQRQGQ